MNPQLAALIAAHCAAANACKVAEAGGVGEKILDKLRIAEWRAFVDVAHYEPATDEEFSRQAEHVRWRWDDPALAKLR